MAVKLGIILLQKIHGFDCYDLDGRARMKTDHLFAPGAVSGRATTHSERRATPRVRGGASIHGSCRKNVVNSYIPTLNLINIC